MDPPKIARYIALCRFWTSFGNFECEIYENWIFSIFLRVVCTRKKNICSIVYFSRYAQAKRTRRNLNCLIYALLHRVCLADQCWFASSCFYILSHPFLWLGFLSWFWCSSTVTLSVLGRQLLFLHPATTTSHICKEGKQSPKAQDWNFWKSKFSYPLLTHYRILTGPENSYANSLLMERFYQMQLSIWGAHPNKTSPFVLQS